MRMGFLHFNRAIGNRLNKVKAGRDFEAKSKLQAFGLFILGVLLFPFGHLLLPVFLLLLYRPSTRNTYSNSSKISIKMQCCLGTAASLF